MILTDCVYLWLPVTGALNFSLIRLDLVHLELQLLQHVLLDGFLDLDAFLMQLFQQFRAPRCQDAHSFRFVDYVEKVVALEQSFLE